MANNKIDYSKLNKLISILFLILKVLLGLSIVLLIYLLINLIRNLKICSILFKIISLLSPLFIGFVVAWLFNPLVNYLMSKKIPRAVGSVVSYILIFIIIFILFKLLIPILIVQANELSYHLPDIVDYISNLVDKCLKKIDGFAIVDVSNVENMIMDSINNISLKIVKDLPNTLINILKGLFEFASNIVLGLTIGFYFLIRFDKVKEFFIKIIPKKNNKELKDLMLKVNSLFRCFVSGTFLITLILFVLQSASFMVIGLTSPIFFGILCAFTNLIPFIGPYIGGIPACIVGFSISSKVGILCIIVIVLCQSIESYILQPIIMSKTMEISAISVICSILIFGYFFGILGIIISTPIVAGIKIILLYVLKKFDIINM